MEAFMIGRAGPNDLDQAWTIVTGYYDEIAVVAREDRPAFERSYFSHGSGIRLARNAGEVVGCIALRPLEVFPASGRCER